MGVGGFFRKASVPLSVLIIKLLFTIMHTPQVLRQQREADSSTASCRGNSHDSQNNFKYNIFATKNSAGRTRKGGDVK
jgi:hypothetical protein